MIWETSPCVFYTSPIWLRSLPRASFLSRALMCLSTWVCAVDSRFSGCLFIVIKGRLPCSSTVSEHCDWKQHTVIVAGTLRQVCIFYMGKKKNKRKRKTAYVRCSLRSKQMDWGGSMKTVCIAKSWLERASVMPTHAKDTQCHENTHIHCIYSTWTCTIKVDFLGGPKENRALLFEKGLFCFLFLFFFFFDLSMLWWCKCPFYLMCPSRMWLALFRLCQCLSTSGPDRRSTWCPIRVVLLAMCAVKIPLHYSFVTQCVEVFFLSVKFRHNSVCVGVRWHGLKKKNEIKQVPILCIYSLLFLLFGLNGEFPREGAHLFIDTMQHVQKAKLFFCF